MIISHKHKFIFIKTKKTAGSSIEVFLSQFCGEQDVLTPVSGATDTPHRARNHDGFRNHMKGIDIRDKLPESVWTGYFKFCVERNPWDKMLSFFHHINKGQYNGRLSFDEFLALKRRPVNFRYYTDYKQTGEILVDRILYYENLGRELKDVFGMFGIPFDNDLGFHIKGDKRKDKRHYRDVLTRAQADQISKIFRKEILLHGYTF